MATVDHLVGVFSGMRNERIEGGIEGTSAAVAMSGRGDADDLLRGGALRERGFLFRSFPVTHDRSAGLGHGTARYPGVPANPEGREDEDREP